MSTKLPDISQLKKKELPGLSTLKKKDDTGNGLPDVPVLKSEVPFTSIDEDFIKQQLDLQEPAFSTAIIKKVEPKDISEAKPMSMETFEDIVAESRITQQKVLQAEEDKKLFEEFDKARTKLRKEATQEELRAKEKEADKGIIKAAPKELRAKFESGELTQTDFFPDGNYFYGYIKNVNRSTASFFRKINGAEKLIAKGLNIASGGAIPESEGVMGQVADWIDKKAVGGITEVPDDLAGAVLSRFGGINMFPAELFLTPQAKIKALSTVTGGAINGIPKLATLLGVGGGLEEYSVTESVSKSFDRAVHGFGDGLFLHMLGGLSSKSGMSASTNPMTQQLTSTGILASGFAGKSAFEQKVTTGEVDIKEVAAEFAFGVALSAPEMLKLSDNYFTSSKNTIRSVENMKVDYKKLTKEYKNLIKEERTEGIIPEKRTEIEIAKQGMQNFISMKFADNDVKNNPNKYRDIVKNDKTLNEQEKQFQLDKIDYIEKEVKEIKPKDIKEGISEPLDVTKEEKPIETIPKKKEAVKEAKIEEPIKKEVENGVQEIKTEAKAETKEAEIKPLKEEKYETKEEFKKDFLSDDINLENIDVPLKGKDKISAAKNLREGKETAQGKILEEYLDKSFKKGTLDLIAPDKKTRVGAKIEDIAKPKKIEVESIEAKKVEIPKEEIEGAAKEELQFKTEPIDADNYKTTKEFKKAVNERTKNIEREESKTLNQIDENNKAERGTSISVPIKDKKKATRVYNEKLKETRELSDLNLESEKWYDKFARKIQDRFRRIDVLQKAITKAGGNITDATDVKMKTELMSGKARVKINNKANEIIQSKAKGEPAVLEKMKKDKVDYEDLGTYMLAKHAKERNLAKQKEVNESINDKIVELEDTRSNTSDKTIQSRLQKQIDKLEGSKINIENVDKLNKKAEDYINKIKNSNKFDLFEKYSNEIRNKLVDENLTQMEEYGLISGETVQILKDKYKNYVPYKKIKENDLLPGTSRLDVKGRDIFRAKNLIDIESKDRTNPIIQLLNDYNRTVIRGEKNEVNKSFLQLVEENPSEYFNIRRPKYNPVFNSEGELVYMDRNVRAETPENTLELKIGGKPVLIDINDPLTLRAMKGVGVERSIKLLNSVNAYLRGVATVYNPEFILTNFTRDIQTATINISVINKKNVKRDLIKNIPKSMKGIWNSERGNLSSEWAKTVEELRALGGEVGWMDVGNLEKLTERIGKQFNTYTSTKISGDLKRGLSTVGQYLESVNKVVEMSSRVSAYKVAVDKGISKEKAALLAKNLTVNFDKKGEWGHLVNSLYLFSNAGIQGTGVLFKNLATSKNVRRMAGGIVTGSYLLNMLNNAINEEDYDKIYEGIKERNLIFMMPSGNYLKLPLPYGYNIFKTLGDVTYDMSVGKKDAIEGGRALLLSLDAAFNPVSSSSLNQMLSPTITDPFVQLSENKNWFGAPIKPSQAPYSPFVPENQLYFSNVRKSSKWATTKINELTGGNILESGSIDISPEIVDHFTDYLMGGAGKFIANTVETGISLKEGDLGSANNVPFARQFYGEKNKSADLKIIYDMSEEVSRTKFDDKDRKKFFKALNNSLRANLIDSKTYDNLYKDFIEGQIKLDIARKNAFIFEQEKEMKELDKNILKQIRNK